MFLQLIPVLWTGEVSNNSVESGQESVVSNQSNVGGIIMTDSPQAWMAISPITTTYA